MLNRRLYNEKQGIQEKVRQSWKSLSPPMGQKQTQIKWNFRMYKKHKRLAVGVWIIWRR